MRYFFPVLRIVAGIAVCIAVVMVSYALKQRLSPTVVAGSDGEQVAVEEDVPNRTLVLEGESLDRLAEKLRKASDSANYKPGEKAFDHIKDLLKANFYFEAEEKLRDLMEKYPYAPVVVEARRILGQYNVDGFLGSGSHSTTKLYKVQPGDSFYEIAKKNETSLSNLMQLNGLFSFDKLYPDDELLVMPLHFNLVIDIPNRRLTLEHGRNFVKDYPFKKLIMPDGSGVKQTIVEAVVGLVNSRPVRSSSDAYISADKVIELKRPSIEIVAHDMDLGEQFQGVVLHRDQLEELAVLLREGNLVEIRY